MILQLIGWASLTILIVDFISDLDDTNRIPNKPFKCDLCMGYWISIFPLTIQYGLSAFLYAAIVGVLADTINRIKNRI